MFSDSTLLDRTIWFVAGCLIGFLVGWFVRHARETETDLKRVDRKLDQLLTRNEAGRASFRSVALVAVILMTAYAAFSSQLTNNRVADVQARQADLATCNQSFLGRTIDALNERTTYSGQQASANLKLQKTQADFLSIVLIRPAVSVERIQDALEIYFDALTEFTTVVTKQQQTVADNPYPSEDELQQCLADARTEAKAGGE